MKKLGKTGPEVSDIGLGCMGMSPGVYAPSSDEEGIATIREAVDRGINLIDTGDFYGTGHNEMLIGRAIKGIRDKVILSVKFGAMRGPDNSWVGFDARPQAVKNFLAYSLKRLGVDAIDVYRPSRLDPAVPIEDTIGTIKEMVQKGYVKHVGLSEVGVETIERANKVHPIVDLQIEYAIASRKPEEKIFPALERAGMSATLYGVFSRGLLSGSKPSSAADFRAHLPRFSQEHSDRNTRVVEEIRAFAQKNGRTPAQILAGWVLAKQPRLVPIVGARTREQLRDILAVVEKPLTNDEVIGLEKIVPHGAIAGDRYQAQQMAHLDSEK